MRDSSDEPCSAFDEAVASVLGRILGFLFACWLADAITLTIVKGDPLHPFHSPLSWFGTVFAGLAEGWGLIAYSILAVIVLFHSLEAPMSTTLLCAYLVQSLETLRCSLDDPGFSGWLPMRVYAFFAVWLPVVILLLLWSLSRWYPGLAVGLFSRLKGTANEEPCDEVPWESSSASGDVP